MRVLVTGVNGQLGFDVVRELENRSIECVGVGRADFDIINEGEVERFLMRYTPDVVIHCAAYTAVDKAEDDQETCELVNVKGTKNIAKVCRHINAKLIYISTDYVFSGNSEYFYEVSDTTGPLGIYGRTKLEGEVLVKNYMQKFFIVRVSWVFGKNGNNFIKTMLKLSETRKQVSVVADQIGSPTYTVDLAPLLCEMMFTEKYGTYHATNEGVCSWAELAEEVFHMVERKVEVKHIRTIDYPTRAVRPKNSRLSKSSLDEGGFQRLPEWKDAVKRYLLEDLRGVEH